MRRAPDYQELLKRGYGHIGRVGYLSPGIVDETLSGQFYRMAPPGVTLVRTSLELKDVTVEEVNAALARAEKAAAELGKYRPDCIVFGGSPTVAVPGHGSDKIIVEKIERASGRRTFAAQAAAIEALQKYGAKKLALATPFPDNVNALVKDFLEKSGFEVLSIRYEAQASTIETSPRRPFKRAWSSENAYSRKPGAQTHCTFRALRSRAPTSSSRSRKSSAHSSSPACKPPYGRRCRSSDIKFLWKATAGFFATSASVLSLTLDSLWRHSGAPTGSRLWRAQWQAPRSGGEPGMPHPTLPRLRGRKERGCGYGFRGSACGRVPE